MTWVLLVVIICVICMFYLIFCVYYFVLVRWGAPSAKATQTFCLINVICFLMVTLISGFTYMSLAKATSDTHSTYKTASYINNLQKIGCFPSYGGRWE